MAIINLKHICSSQISVTKYYNYVILQKHKYYTKINMEALASKEMNIDWEADICMYLVLDDDQERGVSVEDMSDTVEGHSGVEVLVMNE